MEADEAPAGSLETPAVFSEGREERLPVRFGGQLRRSRADLRRVVADIVIARQVTAGNRQRVVQLTGKSEIVGTGRAVEGDVAAVDDEIGAAGVDVFAYPIKVVGQFREAARKMGVGNLGQAKFGHAIFLVTTVVIIRESG